MEHHPRAAEAHNSTNLLSHIGTVAVQRALMAFGLVIPELAVLQAGQRVSQKFIAITAQFLTTVVFPAPQLNHMPDRALFPINAAHTSSYTADVLICKDTHNLRAILPLQFPILEIAGHKQQNA